MHPALAITILLFALLGHGYLWVAAVNRLHGWAGPRLIIDLATYACTAAFAVLPAVVAWEWSEQGQEFFTTEPTDFFWNSAVVYSLGCAMLGGGQLLARFIRGFRDDDPQTVADKKQRFHPPEIPFTRDVLLGIYPKAMGLVPGNQVLRLAIDHKRVIIPRLPQPLAGLRICHVSDLHVTGRIGPAWYMHVADVVNSLKPDVIAITGDLIENENYRPWLYDALARLQAPLGVYFVLGNHDFYIDAERTAQDLVDLGLVHVGSASLQTEWNGYPVVIGGNEAPWRPRPSSLPNTFSSPSPFRLFLLHTPDEFDWACTLGGNLTLAGHTHGGQICFPLLGAVAAPSLYGVRFAGGTFRRGNTVMHVSRGISGETPMRWRCPPEVAILELSKSEE